MIDDSTPGLSVEIVDVRRLPDEQIPRTHRCGFAYTIRILNDSVSIVQLLVRKWMIRQSDGTIETVEGDGVVGEQPVIRPGGRHMYTSYCLLTGDKGAMWGFYFGRDENMNHVTWRIPKFEMSAVDK